MVRDQKTAPCLLLHRQGAVRSSDIWQIIMDDLREKPVSIVGCFAACSETAFSLGFLGCRPNLLRGTAPEPRKGQW